MGAVGCLCRALERYGSLDRATVMRDAISLAGDGWEPDWNLTLSLGLYYDRLAPVDASRAIFFRDGRYPLRTATGLEAGDRLVQRALADSLRAIAADGPEVLYGGELRRRIPEAGQGHGRIRPPGDAPSFTGPPGPPRR